MVAFPSSALLKNRLNFGLLLIVFLLQGRALAGDNETVLTAKLNRLRAPSSFPGFSVSVVGEDRVFYQRSFGYADLRRKVPYTVNTAQPIASVSKTFIAVALMRAISEGLFTLETPVSDLLPFKIANPNFPNSPIKVIHLVTHTSGIVDQEAYKKSYLFAEDADQHTPLHRYLKREGYGGNRTDTKLAGFLRAYLGRSGRWYQPSNFGKKKPGIEYQYSNIASALTAYLIEVKTGRSFADYTRKTIFEPLGMKDTYWVVEPRGGESAAPRARLYSDSAEEYPAYSSATYPDGSLVTSNQDLSRYLREMIRGYKGRSALLPKQAFQMMFAPKFSGGQPPEGLPANLPNSGVFWAYTRNGNIGHTGGDLGVTTLITLSPRTGTGRIFIANSDLDSRGVMNARAVRQLKAIWKALEAYEAETNDR
ncbi:MAG: beta-lactamase family protein [Cytophagales bacterium]|nr:beta-lactamase family protein [Armatimonadota bacterium]